MRRGKVFGSGEAALRISRRIARRRGLTEAVDKIDQILRNDEDAAIVGVALEDETGGGLLRDILAAIWADPEKFINLLKELIAMLEGLFGETAPAE